MEVVHLSMFNNVVLLKKRDLAQTQAMSDEVAECSVASAGVVHVIPTESDTHKLY